MADFKELGTFDIIYCDPPWLYANGGSTKGKATDHYNCMSMKELKCLPVNELANADCALLMWTTGPMMKKAVDLMGCWGFEYRTVFTVWDKLNPVKLNSVTHPGYYSLSSCEFLLVGMKGKLCNLKSKPVFNVRKLQHLPRSVHSKKPDIIRNLIEQFFGKAERKIELFARKQIEGWECWGNETNKFNV